MIFQVAKNHTLPLIESFRWSLEMAREFLTFVLGLILIQEIYTQNFEKKTLKKSCRAGAQK